TSAEDDWGVGESLFVRFDHEFKRCLSRSDDHVWLAIAILDSEPVSKLAWGSLFWKQSCLQILVIELDLVRRFFQTSCDRLIHGSKAGGRHRPKVVDDENAPHFLTLRRGRILEEQ